MTGLREGLPALSSQSDSEGELLSRMAGVVSARLPMGSGSAGLDRATRFLQRGVLDTVEHGRVEDLNAAWSETAPRSRARFLHGFLFLSDMRALLENGDEQQVRRLSVQIVALLQEWQQRFPLGRTDHPMAYHDETTAQRLIHVFAVLPLLAGIDHGDREWVENFLAETGELLSSDGFYAGLNNHGMFQDIGLMAFAALGTWSDPHKRVGYFEKANARILGYFRACFTSEGVHVENAPNYHVLVARYVKEHHDLLERIGSDDAPPLAELVRSATRYATHAVMPTGSYPLISDTQPTHLPAVARNVFQDAGFLFAATRGLHGSRPQQRVIALAESGYAIYRSSWGDPEATYVLFQAAYNSGYHKHSDDNSLWISSGGHDLLTEAGPNGYDYADPLTQYAYSQFAHNTVIAGGRSTPRHDERMRDVSMDVHEVRDDGFRVTGRNGRLAGAVHERTVSIEEGESSCVRIGVHDRIRCAVSQRLQMLWNVGPGLEVRTFGNGFDLAVDGATALSLRFSADAVVDVSLHSGETTPNYLGWRFEKIGQARPSPVVVLNFSGTDVDLHTTIRLGAGGQRARPGKGSGSGASLAAELLDGSGGGIIDARMEVSGALQYAFKLYRGSEVVAEVPYSRAASARWEDLAAGRYRVRGYARKRVGELLIAETSRSLRVR